MFIEHKPDLNFSPGDKYSYSNTGYLILALALEKAAGKPLTDFVTEKIIKPLNLANTFPYNLTMEAYPANRVYGYHWDDDSLKLNDLYNIDGVFGDGNMYSSATDLQKWSQALYGGEPSAFIGIDARYSEGSARSGYDHRKDLHGTKNTSRITETSGA